MFSKKAEVKNKAPAPIQITAEQLLREAVERQADEIKPPPQRIVDDEELEKYRVGKRREFEDTLRRNRQNIGTWIKYALWEAGQKEIRRARSVFERALNVEPYNTTLWLKYIDMETSHKYINSARNLYNRVVALLPREDQFWFKFAGMEEILGNYAGARCIFDRWMEWIPNEKGWMLFVKFEERCGEVENARQIFHRFIRTCPDQTTFLKYGKFEERHRNFSGCRDAYKAAVAALPPNALDEHFYIKYAEFEQRAGDHDRAKEIMQDALKKLPRSEAEELYRKYVSIQKQHGDREAIEDVIFNRRRIEYEQRLAENSMDYDTWFGYIRLEECCCNLDKARAVYDRAVSNLPPIMEKKYWKRYIYLWINYVLFEETLAKSVTRCREVYDRAMKVIPHQSFTSAKLWRLYADFELRQLELTRARRVFGNAIARCRKERIFTSYANLELRLGNIDRCREIYRQFAIRLPKNPKAWTSWVELELMAEESERARGLCEMALTVEDIQSPESVWKCYLDMEANLGEIAKARALYKRLLEKTQHFKVFKGYADFELRVAGSMERARAVIDRGLESCKESGAQEERVLLLEHLVELEKENGDSKKIEVAFARLPRKVTKKRSVVTEDGESQGWEEYVSYVFPDDGPAIPGTKILELAHQWKKRKLDHSE